MGPILPLKSGERSCFHPAGEARENGKARWAAGPCPELKGLRQAELGGRALSGAEGSQAGGAGQQS